MQYLNSLGRRFLEINYDRRDVWMHALWRGRLSTENVLLGCEHVLTALRQDPVADLLNDNREVTGAWPHINDWLVDQWLPQAQRLGLRRLAHVLAPGPFARPLAEELKQRVAHRCDIALFEEVADAEAWLRGARQAAAPSVLEEATE